MVNQVVLVGRITKDVEVRTTTTGREVCNFSLAVNRNFKNANGEYDADFVNCIAFGQTAKFMGQYIQKGRLISVTGRIQTRNYENNQNQRIYVTEVIADNVNVLESRRDGGQVNFNQQPSVAQTTGPESFMNQEPATPPMQDVTPIINDDDLPF